MQSKKKIFLTSNNPAKVEAVKIVCSKLFDVFSIKHEDIASGVSDTPFTDDEAILGCYTRINSSEHNLSEHVDYIIALEGLIEKKSFGQFVYGWAVIKEMESSSFFYGCSGKVYLPNRVMQKMSSQKRLSDVVLELYPGTSSDELKLIGTNGVLTGGLYTRAMEFETALLCAFGSMMTSKV
ncbi:inosine/xanthosine triphosphatase [Escherichia coli]|uniref:inosine/xanthosine triphosphatase n=1 Tax=Escherichia coli TaxID=562 RepID=UPI0037BFFBB7